MAEAFGPFYIGNNSRDSTSTGTSETDGSASFGTINTFSNQGRLDPTYYQNGYIFADISLPQGSKIITATISIWSTFLAFGNRPDSVEWKVAGLDVDNILDAGAWSVNFRPGTGGVNFIIGSTNDVLVLTSDQGGPVNVDIPDGTYTGAELATALQTAMNNDATLTGGVITFGVSYAANRLALDATAGHTIAYTTIGSDAGLTCGFSEDAAAAQTITSNFDIPGRPPETAAKVDWDRTGFVADTLYTSPDISAILQELVDRPGWVSANSMGFIVRNDGANIGHGVMRHVAVSDIGNARRAFIEGTYQAAGGQIISIQII